MNIIARQQKCSACNVPGAPFTLTACMDDCLRIGAGKYVDASTHGHQPNPHLHVKCPTCGFVWLEDVADPDGVKAAL
jgi:hypothetical protein